MQLALRLHIVVRQQNSKVVIRPTTFRGWVGSGEGGPTEEDVSSENAVKVPLLLRVAMALGAVFGVLGTATGLWGLFQLVGSDGPFQMGEDVVPKVEFLGVAVPFLVLYVSACLTAGAASWAIWKHRARSRILWTALLGEFVIGDAAMLALARRLFDISVSELASSVLVFSVLVGLGLWYLFRKESVAAYYESVR